MDNPYILVIIGVVLLICVVFISSNLYYKKLYRHFSRDYIDWSDVDKDYNLHNIRKYVSELPKDRNSFYVDDQTWSDLDLDNIYSRLNKHQSTCGADYLYTRLRFPYNNQDDLNNFSNLIKLFKEDNSLRIETSILLSKIGHINSYEFHRFFFEKPENKINNIWIYYFLRYGLIASILLLLVIPSVALPLLLLLFAVNVITSLTVSKVFEADILTFRYFGSMVVNAKKLLKLGALESYHNSSKLREILNRLSSLKKSFGLSLESDSKLSEYEILGGLISSLFLNNVISYHKIVKALDNNYENIHELYKYLGELDCAIVLGLYQNSLAYYCTPVFDNTKDISIEEMYHPLVVDPVTNSLVWSDNMIITGSNASGKSTFVKGLALNLIFAQSFNFAYAKAMTTDFVQVITSMATTDSLELEESYFIAEIKSLKRIFDSINDNHKVVAFIDEILRGTNTIERISASVAILDSLSKQNCLVAIATHDIELTEIMNNQYRNYHFKESIVDDDIVFDYCLYPGPTTTRNAILLLELLKYPHEITKKAFSIVDYHEDKGEWPHITSVK